MTDLRHLEIAPCPVEAVRRLERELAISRVTAQVLVRRGHGDVDEARTWLAAADAFAPGLCGGMADGVAVIRDHLKRGSKITIHGDYDVDGICSTVILVRALRALGGEVDWYLPSRLDDGYGLNPRTVERLAATHTNLLVTADCGITAVDEVALARSLGMDVVVTDHHAPRVGGALPDAPIIHPAVGAYPCPDLCATGVAAKVAEALGAPTVGEDLDLVALATIADVVPLQGENRRLVREGLHALATTAKPGLRALMRVARCDPQAIDAKAVGFRLAPRINAAGRLSRADAGLELILTDDPERAAEIAEELDRANAERRHVEQRMLFEAEAQAAQQEGAIALVVAAEGWHPGVAGIVASRLADRHHRPAVVIALDGGEGSGSGRSIPAFDLLGGLDACAEHLVRHGGHRAAAGLSMRTEDVDAFRAAFTAHASAVLGAGDLVRVERVDAVASGEDLGRELAEELQTLAPFGMGNPGVSLLVPAARLTNPRPMGEGKHVRFTVETGAIRARAVAFGCAGRLPVEVGEPVDATFTLELDDWGGAVEPRLVLRHAQPCVPGPVTLVGDPGDWIGAALAELERPPGGEALAPAADTPGSTPGPVEDRRDVGVAGTISALVASGEPVLVVCADARRRYAPLAARLGGFALTDWPALGREPEIAARYPHVVALDPPAEAAALGQATVWAWGAPELDFARKIHDSEYGLRVPLTALYRALRATGGAGPEHLEAVLRADGRSPALAGRALRVLAELGLVEVDRAGRAVTMLPERRTDLERSAAFRAYEARRVEGFSFLTTARATAAAA